MTTSILVKARYDVEYLARRILRDLGYRNRTVLKTVGVNSTNKAMEAVAEVAGRTVAAALRHNVPPERTRFFIQLRPRRVRHPRDDTPRDGYRIDVYLASGNEEVETALRTATFHTGTGFADVSEEAGVHLDGDAVAAEGGEVLLRQAVMSAWERIRHANGDVIALRLAGILDADTPLLSYEMVLGPVEIQGQRGVRVLLRRASLVAPVNEEGEGESEVSPAATVPAREAVAYGASAA